MRNCLLIVFPLICFISSCTQNPEQGEQNEIDTEKEVATALPSWADSETKDEILKFVKEATASESENFIPVEDRIAVFDNDGTLWAEQPIYFQVFFAFDRIRQMAPEHPEWKDQQPYQAVLENDWEKVAEMGMEGLASIIMTSHAGITVSDFEILVKTWIDTARHPETDMLYTEMVYQPMLELIDYLQQNEFKTFIVSGGGIEFMRPWAEEVYGIPKNQIIGSSIKTEFVLVDSVPQINRLPELDFIDDKAGKPVGIYRFIGKKPVFCGGNSDGDLAMMQYTASNEHNSFMLYIHHTDSDREWAYDRDSHVGHFDNGLNEALAKGWTIVDMKSDWKTIFPE